MRTYYFYNKRDGGGHACSTGDLDDPAFQFRYAELGEMGFVECSYWRYQWERFKFWWRRDDESLYY